MTITSAITESCRVFETRSNTPVRNDGVNVALIERIASALMGGGLIACGVSRLNSVRGVVATLAGAGLLYRGATGHCSLYAGLGINTAPQRNSATGVPAQEGTRVEKTIVVNCTPEKAYRFWRNLENLPRFMRHLESVRDLGAHRSHWVAKAPLGMEVEWDAEIINERENELIAWRSIEGSEVDTAGSVHFALAPGLRGTEIHVNLKYAPPGGKLGIAIAKVFGEDAATQINEDLQRLKQVLETGETATTEGQTSGRANFASCPADSPVVRDHVDEASAESFPASDPPSWTTTSATPPSAP